MAKTIISEGKTSMEAIEKGLKELKVSKDKVNINIIEDKKKKSFFNILEPHIVKVEISLKEDLKKDVNTKENKQEKKENIKLATSDELKIAKENIKNFIKDFSKKISQDINSDIFIENNYIYVNLCGGKATNLIGYRGEALNSLQIILSSIASKNLEHPVKVILDIERYKEKRKKTLEELAKKIENTVYEKGKKITLEPMTAYDRKIIHTALQNSEKVKTYSIGEENNRRIVIEKNN